MAQQADDSVPEIPGDNVLDFASRRRGISRVEQVREDAWIEEDEWLAGLPSKWGERSYWRSRLCAKSNLDQERGNAMCKLLLCATVLTGTAAAGTLMLLAGAAAAGGAAVVCCCRSSQGTRPSGSVEATA